ncbi:MAG: hypothetical protein EOO67_07090 [Microbacterium sp.]|nr:MAG: hypothetical protein EOO67_07090 [Microbacterium sp.]
MSDADSRSEPLDPDTGQPQEPVTGDEAQQSPGEPDIGDAPGADAPPSQVPRPGDGLGDELGGELDGDALAEPDLALDQPPRAYRDGEEG